MASEWWNDQPASDAATPVTVEWGIARFGIDAVLGGGRIVGTVTDTDTGDPLPDKCVQAQNGVVSRSTTTSSTGAYRFGDLPAGGPYFVTFDDCPGTTNEYIELTKPATVTNGANATVDGALAPRLCNGQTPTITGTPGNDTLKGTGGRDVILAGGGDDVINGMDGGDVICGGAGNDVISARDGSRDVIECGAGLDRVTADRRDRLRGCERVSRR